jgi:hypothetical protein
MYEVSTVHYHCQSVMIWVNSVQSSIKHHRQSSMYETTKWIFPCLLDHNVQIHGA